MVTPCHTALVVHTVQVHDKMQEVQFFSSSAGGCMVPHTLPCASNLLLVMVKLHGTLKTHHENKPGDVT